MESAHKELLALEQEKKRIHSGVIQFQELSDTNRQETKKANYDLKKNKLFKQILALSLGVNNFASNILLKFFFAAASAIGVGCVMLIIFGLLFNQVVLGFTAGCLIGITASVLLFLTKEATASNGLAVAKSEIHRLKDLLVVKKKDLDSLNANLKNAKSRMKQVESQIARIKESFEYKFRQRAAELLSVQVITLSGIQFEEYLKEVFEHLGAIVRETPATGDQGADLIVQFGSVLIAVQAKRHLNNVGNEAVQQAFSGKGFYRCDFCAVVTNSSFTRQAIELAEKIDCLLIDGEKLESLVQGNLKIPGMS